MRVADHYQSKTDAGQQAQKCGKYFGLVATGVHSVIRKTSGAEAGADSASERLRHPQSQMFCQKHTKALTISVILVARPAKYFDVLLMSDEQAINFGISRLSI